MKEAEHLLRMRYSIVEVREKPLFSQLTHALIVIKNEVFKSW